MATIGTTTPLGHARTVADVFESRRWWALIVLCAAQFIVIVDTSIVAIALPAIQADFDFSSSSLP